MPKATASNLRPKAKFFITSFHCLLLPWAMNSIACLKRTYNTGITKWSLKNKLVLWNSKGYWPFLNGFSITKDKSLETAGYRNSFIVQRNRNKFQTNPESDYVLCQDSKLLSSYAGAVKVSYVNQLQSNPCGSTSIQVPVFRDRAQITIKNYSGRRFLFVLISAQSQLNWLIARPPV